MFNPYLGEMNDCWHIPSLKLAACPENRPLRKGNSYWKAPCLGASYVSFREGIFQKNIDADTCETIT